MLPERKAPAALILAGGLSTRMGSEKATLTIESKPLIRWAFDAANKFACHIYISVHDEDAITRYKPLLPTEVTFIKDLYEGPRSALLAMLSSFKYITEETVAVTPVDSPFISGDLMAYMTSKAKSYDLVVPMWPDGRIEAIHAVYNPVKLVPVLQGLWSKGIFELKQIPRHAKATLFISTESLSEYDVPLLSLLDADTPSEFNAMKSTKAAIH